jgi:hypothetical protein
VFVSVVAKSHLWDLKPTRGLKGNQELEAENYSGLTTFAISKTIEL